jgi:DNA-binding MarR family transcriptional regulator
LPLVHLLRAVTVELDLFAAEFARVHRLHGTDLRALIALLDAGRTGLTATPGWLGGQLRLNSAAVTALVDRLDRLGYVERLRDDADRRRVRLIVTERAVALGWSFFGPLITQLVTATQDYSNTELATVHRFLTATAEVVVAARRDQREEPPAERSASRGSVSKGN